MLLQQVIMCTIKIRRAPPARHDNVVDFKPTIVSKTSKKIKPLSVVAAVVADKGYDSEEENHALVRDKLHAYSSIIPPRYQDVPIWKKTHGKYRKEMKRGYLKPLYNQRNKDDETIFSVIKRLFGEHVTSRRIRTQNRELTFMCIAYNMHRVTNLLLLMMVSTKPSNISPVTIFF
jgi:hypothetical protein